jgi:plastocyanin
MRKNLFRYCRLYLAVLLLAACAGLQPEVTVSPGAGEKVLAVKASSFKFEPNNIKAYTGDVILLKIENVSGSSHNFTIKNPGGQVMQSADLPPGKLTDVSVTLSEKGVYDFYCDKPFHAGFGMKGRIEAVDR